MDEGIPVRVYHTNVALALYVSREAIGGQPRAVYGPVKALLGVQQLF